LPKPGQPPPRIFRIRYRSAVNGRVAEAFAKVPYSALFDLNEKLARMVSQNQIRWFRVDVANPVQIDEHRGSLERWQPALRATQAITKVDFDA
jgi:hypothetical protein